jgi:hypothetical protein
MHANSELAAIAWLKAQPGLPTNAIGTTLPMESEDGTVPSWVDTGFVQIIVHDGSRSGVNIGYRAPVITAHCWSANPGKQRPRWHMANDLAEEIWAACLVEGNGIENLACPVNIASPPRIRVLQVWGIQEPKRTPFGFPTMGRGKFINPGNCAQYTVDFQIAWAELPQ